MRFGCFRCRSLEIFALFVLLLLSQVSCSTATADPPPVEPLGPAGTNGQGFGAHDASARTSTGGAPVFGAFEGGARAIQIAPGTAVLEVDPSSGSKADLQLSLVGQVAEPPVWSLTNSALGSVNQDGLFVASGAVGGETDVIVRIGRTTVTAHVTVVIRYRQNGATRATLPGDAGGLTSGGVGGVGGDGVGAAIPDALVSVLDGPAFRDAALSLLYPYDKTVFPLGVLPPLLQWSAGNNGHFDAIRIHVEVPKYFQYDGYFGRPARTAASSAFVRHPIPDDVWRAATATAAGGTLSVSLSLSAGGLRYGPLAQTYRIAPGKVSGTIYYQAYNTELAKNYDGALAGGRFGGATLSITVGAEGPRLVAGKSTSDTTGCRVCHSVSAYGDRMLVQRGEDSSATSLYDLRNGNAESKPYTGALFANGFPGIHPSGRIALSNSVDLRGSSATADALLYDVATGAAVTTTGLAEFATKLALPMFSPDGKHVAFIPWAARARRPSAR